MASIIRIKRSSVSGNPTTLAAGELAYSNLTDNGSNGGDRLYIGMGTETAGNAANRIVLGGKFFTDRLDHTAGTLTASSALVVDSNSKIDNLKVDNLDLNGNTISSTDTNGKIILDPNGTGVVEVVGDLTVTGSINATIAAASAAKWTTARNLSLTGDATATLSAVDGTADVSATLTLATVNSSVGAYGSSTSIPVITVNGKGLVTSVTTQSISTTLSVAADTGTTDNVSLGSDTLTFTGGEGIDTAVTNNTITISAEDASTSNKGVASFADANFTVSSGAVTAKNITLGSSTLSLGSTTTAIAGITELTVDNININGNEITSTNSNGNISLNPNGTGTVDVNGARISGLGAPTQDTDAATKLYVDTVAEGLSVKPAVRVATTANITATYNNGTNGVGATLTIAATATLTIDGVNSWAVGDGILVKNQTSAFQNGRYYVSTVGNISAAWVLTRCSKCDEPTEIPSMYVFVQEGTTYASTGWVATVEDFADFDVGVDDITFTQFSGAGTYLAGDGLTITGSTFNVVGTADRITANADSVDIASTYVGQSSITTLGTITTGTWQGSVVGPTYGGTGVNNGSKTITLGGSFTHTGAHTLGLTTTANTSVTLPTTGTLATLAGTESLSNKTITSSSFSGTTIAGSGLITFTNSTDASNLTTAAVVLSGGLAVTKAMYVGTNITGAGADTSTLDGFQIDGGTY
jgi:hypothetical protein